MSSVEEGIYDVEKILKDKTIKGKKYYLIKWLGYSITEATWEREDDIFCEELKRDYEEGKERKTPVVKKQPAPKSKFRLQITNEWDDYIKKVVGVSQTNTGGLEVEYVTYEGKKGVCDKEEIHSKAPLKLLSFYEENLQFPE